MAVGNEPTARLASLLAGDVVHAGFSTTLEAQAEYRLHGALYVDDLEAGGWYWSRGTLNLTLAAQDGDIRGHWEWALKASGRQPELARQRLVQEVDRVFRDRLGRAILSSQ